MNREKKATITDDVRDAIVTLSENGLTSEKISKLVSCSETTCRYTLHLYNAVKNGSFNGVPVLRGFINVEKTAAWACKKFPENNPEDVVRAVNRNDEAVRKSNKRIKQIRENAGSGEPFDVAPADLTTVEEAIHVSARLIADKVTEQVEKSMNEMCQKLLGKLDSISTIIQSCSANEIQKANANADNEFRELQKAVEHLAAVRSNTKRK